MDFIEEILAEIRPKNDQYDDKVLSRQSNLIFYKVTQLEYDTITSLPSLVNKPIGDFIIIDGGYRVLFWTGVETIEKSIPKDVYDAMVNSNSPSLSNLMATMDDVNDVIQKQAIVNFKAIAPQGLTTSTGINDGILDFPVVNIGVTQPTVIDFNGTELDIKERHSDKYGSIIASFNFSNTITTETTVVINEQVSYNAGVSWAIVSSVTANIPRRVGGTNGFGSIMVLDYIEPTPAPIPTLVRYQAYASQSGCSLESAILGVEGYYK